MRRLILDGQVFQTPAFHRGMGKYSIELIRSLAKLNKKQKYWDIIEVLLSSELETKKAVEEMATIKETKIKTAILNLRRNEVGNNAVVVHNRGVIDEYIDNLNNVEVDYIILSLLQGEIYPVFPRNHNVRKCLLYYDLIPLIFHDLYLGNPITRMEYLSKISEFLKSDVYFGISATTSNDLALYLGVDTDRIINIDGGPIEHGSTTSEIEIPRPFILMPTGNDLRKNNERGILGFAEFNAQRGNRFSLVITSYFKDFEIEYLSSLASNIIFTGNISGEELNYLYQEAEALLFPTEYEGLGLPILEAFEYNKPVACSDIPVFRELTKTACSFFDPRNVHEITQALTRCIDGINPVSKTEYKKVVDTYTWERTAGKVAAGLTKGLQRAPSHTLKKIAVVGTNPSGSLMSAKFMLENHAELSRAFNVSYYLEGNHCASEKRINYLPYITEVQILGLHRGIKSSDYSAIMYHIDNTAECFQVLFTALANPGIVILHSLSLDKVWGKLTKSELIHKNRYVAEKHLHRTFGGNNTNFLISLLKAQKAIIVLSEQDKRTIQRVLTAIECDIPVIVIPLATSTLPYPEILPEKMPTDSNPYALETMISTASKDYEIYDRMSHLTDVAVKTQENYLPLEALEAMKFGVMPKKVLSATSLFDSLEDASTIELIKYISQKHSHKLFVERLIELLNILEDEQV